jgi:tRNA A37 threonylcarbamoyladenosine modification protein TsaB
MKENKSVSLFINTSTHLLELGLLYGSDAVTVKLGDPKKALERTHVGIRTLLEERGLMLADVDAFYCLLGPGSNTGIRLGLAIPRTIYGINPAIKIYGIMTLDVLLAGQPTPSTAVLSDRSGNLYVASSGVPSYHKINKADVSLADWKGIIVEKSDALAQSELSNRPFTSVDVLTQMIAHKDAFLDFSDHEQDYLPEYLLKI